MPVQSHREKSALTFWTSNTVISFAVACLVIFTYIAYFVVYKNHNDLDNSVALYFLRHRSKSLLQTMTVITYFGSSIFLLPSYLILTGVQLARKHFHEAIGISLSASLSWLLVTAIKISFHRTRPELAYLHNITTFSFPSAHTFSSWIFFSMVSYLIARHESGFTKRILIPILIQTIPIMVGLSRIVLNVHYFTDVIAGICLGIIWLLLSQRIFDKIVQRHNAVKQV